MGTQDATDVKTRILFVDDDPMILRMISRLLEDERDRWDMVFVVGGEAAISAIERTEFDVLVTDFSMPGVNGVAVLAAAKRLAPRMTRILFTASIVDPRLIDAVEILEKPCTRDRLRGLLERASARVIPPRATGPAP